MKILLNIALATTITSICIRQMCHIVSRMVARRLFEAYMDALDNGEDITITIKRS